MEKFTDNLLVESFGNDGRWILKRSFSFYYLDKRGRIDLVIPEGFITDFASTPSMLYSIFPPIGIYNKAAIIHDFLYSYDCGVSRKKADLFFLQAMEVLSVPRWKRELMFAAVRIFGRKNFRKN